MDSLEEVVLFLGFFLPILKSTEEVTKIAKPYFQFICQLPKNTQEMKGRKKSITLGTAFGTPFNF